MLFRSVFHLFGYVLKSTRWIKQLTARVPADSDSFVTGSVSVVAVIQRRSEPALLLSVLYFKGNDERAFSSLSSARRDVLLGAAAELKSLAITELRTFLVHLRSAAGTQVPVSCAALLPPFLSLLFSFFF